VCDQRETEGRSPVGSDVVDQRGWTAAQYSAHPGTMQLPKPSFDALTPPHGSSSIVNSSGPGGLTPLMCAAMSSATEAGRMDVLSVQRKSATIVQDLVAEGASTEDRTDFSGAFCVGRDVMFSVFFCLPAVFIRLLVLC